MRSLVGFRAVMLVCKISLALVLCVTSVAGSGAGQQIVCRDGRGIATLSGEESGYSTRGKVATLSGEESAYGLGRRRS